MKWEFISAFLFFGGGAVALFVHPTVGVIMMLTPFAIGFLGSLINILEAFITKPRESLGMSGLLLGGIALLFLVLLALIFMGGGSGGCDRYETNAACYD